MSQRYDVLILVTGAALLGGFTLGRLYRRAVGPVEAAPAPAEPTAAAVQAALAGANPAYDGRGRFRLRDGRIVGAWLGGTGVANLGPLRGLPLVELEIDHTPVADLSPVAGCPLRRLRIDGTNVTDLTPLKRLPLTRLIFSPGRIRAGIDDIRRMETLTELGATPAEPMAPAKFWRRYGGGERR